jgi:4-hydroxy-tetrahydrodipicolinate reductase
MNIAIFGYGKMGKEIEKICLERGHTISQKISSSSIVSSLDFSKTDVAIEFSTPATAEKNILFCINHKIPVIIGTTGEWYNNLKSIEALCLDKGTAMLPATNFSLGVNLFFELNTHLANLMNNYKDYNCAVKEIHHTEKLDSPSGTGITIVEQIISEHSNYNNWENVNKFEISNVNVLTLESERIPNVPGTHEVVYENEIDKIEIKHTAHSRKGFALGSVIAAEWILNKQGVFSMKDVLNLK